MSYPIILKGEDVYVNTSLYKPNLMKQQIGIREMYTRFGFVVPLSYQSMQIFDLLEDGIDSFQINDNDWLACVAIDHKGHVREHMFAKAETETDQIADRITRRVLYDPLHPKSFYFRSHEPEVEKLTQLAFNISQTTESAIKAMDWIEPTMPPNYQKLQFSTIVNHLVTKGYTDKLKIGEPTFQKK